MTHRDHHHSERQNHTAAAAAAPVAAPAAGAGPTTQSVRARAYALSVKRGGGPGSPIEDWRQAEAELREEQRRVESHPQDR